MYELLPPQMGRALWVVQGLLVFVFLAAGLLKTTQPIAELAQFGPWVTAYPSVIVRLIGITEILCALSLLLVGIFHFTTLLTFSAQRHGALPHHSPNPHCSQRGGAGRARYLL